MNRRDVLLASVALVTLSQAEACALILDGPKKPTEHDGEINWGYLVADIFLTGLVGLVIDFATGAIYRRTAPADARRPLPQTADELALLGGGTGSRVQWCREVRVASRDAEGLEAFAAHLESHVHDCPRCARSLARAEEVVDLSPVTRGRPAVLPRIVRVRLPAGTVPA
jgi:hypothetical protein